jgi:hypothetical protein
VRHLTGFSSIAIAAQLRRHLSEFDLRNNNRILAFKVDEKQRAEKFVESIVSRH